MPELKGRTDVVFEEEDIDVSMERPSYNKMNITLIDKIE
jgi:hypothetical protein